MPEPAREYLVAPNKEAIALLPLFVLPAPQRIYLPTQAHHFDRALRTLRRAGAIGFDTETKSMLQPGEVVRGPHLVQLATEREVFLVQTAREGALPMLKAILEDPAVVKAGFGLANDRRPLRRHFGIRLESSVDLTQVIKALGYRQLVGLKAATAIYLGRRLRKKLTITRSDWSRLDLWSSQRQYAAEDAMATLLIYRALGSPAPETQRATQAKPTRPAGEPLLHE